MSGRYEHQFDYDCKCTDCVLIQILERIAEALEKQVKVQ
jgi:hypothetical protein